jgi:glycosyltransferase involved in cell wall biosynthesis
MTAKLGILSTHPIQYYTPLYQALATRSDLDVTVYYAHKPTPAQQAEGFGAAFEWDLRLLDGYRSVFLENRARRPSLSGFRGCDTPGIWDVIRQEQFDAFLVHGWHAKTYWQAITACWRTGTPVMVRGDSTLTLTKCGWRKAVKQFTHRLFVPRFDAYLIVGQRAREYYRAYGADERKMVFSPHFVDNARFAAASARVDRDALRRQWGLPTAGPVFLFAGKFIPKKRPADFVRAVAAAARSVPGVAGLMVGDGPLRADVETAVRAEAAPVRLVGFLNQTAIPAAYAAADVLVLPSDGGETWGLVVNEAMACGLPAVVSDLVGCGPDLVRPGESGEVYPCGDVAVLAGRLARLAGDPGAVARLGAAARSRVAAYSVEAAAAGAVAAVARVTSRVR